MQEQVDALEAQLQEKNQLVTALTQRLEQAAEQLDRLKRNGGDRPGRGGGGLPPELVEEQKNLVEDLNRVVEQWENMQAGATLGRIEIQVTEVRDLISGQIANGGFQAGAAPAEPNMFGGSPEVDSQPATSDNGNSGLLDALKAGLLNEADNGEETPTAETNEAAPSFGADFGSESSPPLEEIDPVDPPAEIELDSADADTLRQAVEERDSYILHLIQRLKAAESNRFPPVNWEALENAPEELKTRLQDLEAQLDRSLRMAEVEQSLERARLGREAIRIDQLEQHLEKEKKRLNLGGASDDGNDESDDTSKGSRWMRLLGKQAGDE